MATGTLAQFRISVTDPADAGARELKDIPVDKIEPNPDNPRMVFRQGDLEQLMESIRQYSVQVPIAVYRQGSKYVLIDGQRRWMSSVKLNRKTIPALVQQRPDDLKNLLLMFNIHALREQWDLLTVALKLPKIKELLEKELQRKPKDTEIAELTGLPSAWIRRSQLLLDLPENYRDMLLDELHKPKSQQKISEDFFIEMERALNVIEKRMPEAFPNRNRDRARRVLLTKYRDGVISNIVQFRQLSRIARAPNVVEMSERSSLDVLKLVFEKNDYSIEAAYNESVSGAYFERDLQTRIHGLLTRLTGLRSEDLEDAVKEELKSLVALAQELLESE